MNTAEESFSCIRTRRQVSFCWGWSCVQKCDHMSLLLMKLLTISMKTEARWIEEMQYAIKCFQYDIFFRKFFKRSPALSHRIQPTTLVDATCGIHNAGFVVWKTKLSKFANMKIISNKNWEKSLLLLLFF